MTPSPRVLADYVREEWRETPYDEREPYHINTRRVARLGKLLLTCKMVRDEAQGFLASAVHLKVYDHEYEINDIPATIRQIYLARIQQVSLMASDDLVRRHEHRFDIRQLPNLKRLYVLEPSITHTKYVFVDPDYTKLVSYVNGAKDLVFIGDWFGAEAKVSKWQRDFVARQTPAIQEYLHQKYNVRYWLRRLMLDASKQTFKIVCRRNLTLKVQIANNKGNPGKVVPWTFSNDAPTRIFLVSRPTGLVSWCSQLIGS